MNIPMPRRLNNTLENHSLTPASVAASVVPDACTYAAPPLRDALGLSRDARAIASDRMAIYKAAKAIHRSPAFVMDLVNAGLLKAYRRGGPVDRPWLAVDLSELLAVVNRETLYVPPALEGRRAPRPRVDRNALHPLAAAI